jgi:hypothetical protein
MDVPEHCIFRPAGENRTEGDQGVATPYAAAIFAHISQSPQVWLRSAQSRVGKCEVRALKSEDEMPDLPDLALWTSHLTPPVRPARSRRDQIGFVSHVSLLVRADPYTIALAQIPQLLQVWLCSAQSPCQPPPAGKIGFVSRGRRGGSGPASRRPGVPPQVPPQSTIRNPQSASERLGSFGADRHHRGTEPQPGHLRPQSGNSLWDPGISVVHSSYLAEVLRLQARLLHA